MKRLILAAACALALAACSNPEEERKAQEAATAAAKAQQEEKAEGVAKQYDMAVAAQDWERARIHGGSLLDQYKDTDVAARIEPGYAEVKAKAETARELRRMQGLWQYNQVPVGSKGNQVSASIYSKERVDVDGSGPTTVQLIFRDHPEWKRHAYLVLQAGDFRCPQCTVKVTVDDGESRSRWPPGARRPTRPSRCSSPTRRRSGSWPARPGPSPSNSRSRPAAPAPRYSKPAA